MIWGEVFQTLITLYAGFGAYCGYMWSRYDEKEPWSIPMALTVGAFLGVFLWPLCIMIGEDADRLPAPTKKTVLNKAARDERKRMNNELSRERGRVMMIEASAAHRKEMAELAERCRRAEEVA